MLYYVDNSVAGPGTGTFADPWDDLSSNLGSLNPGDICYIRQGLGTYNEGEVTIAVSGTAVGGNITIAAYPGETVVWNCGAGDSQFDISGDYITISGFEIDMRGQGERAIDLKGDNCTIQDCEIHDSDYNYLIQIRGSNNTITNCEIYDTFLHKIRGTVGWPDHVRIGPGIVLRTTRLPLRALPICTHGSHCRERKISR